MAVGGVSTRFCSDIYIIIAQGGADVESAGGVVAKKFDDKRVFSREKLGAFSMVPDVEKLWPTDELQYALTLWVPRLSSRRCWIS